MKSRNKDKKTHESLIGKIIYGFLLFMPLLAIFVTCAYAIFNKNAYLSANTNNVDSIQVINNNDDIIFNTEYILIYKEYTLSNNEYSPRFVYSKIDIDWSEYINGLDNSQVVSFDIRYDTNNNNYIYLRNSDGQYIYVNGSPSIIYNKWGSEINEIIMTLTNVTDTQNYSKARTELTKVILVPQTLNDTFYYSIDKVEESPLFNWAENSAIYTGINTTCNTLNITTPFIPLLMTYWLIISVIYILYDIILVILHIFHKKIHQLEDTF